jgi:hypothetical protein
MNALEASRVLVHRRSAAYRSDLAVDADPAEVMRFASALCTDDEFRTMLADRPAEMLEGAGLGAFAGEFVAAKGLLDVDDYSLTPEELQAFLDICDRLRDSGLLAQNEVELQLAEEGYGLPAVAALALLVAIAVGVYLYVKG